MAIHADYPGLTVEIYVDGRPLKEYEHEEEQDKTKTTTRYIECRSGAEFAIKTNFKSPFVPMDIELCVSLDEVTVHRYNVFKAHMFKRPLTQSTTRWEENGTWRASRFLFSDLSVVEENSKTTFGETREALKSVGTISVTLTPILSYWNSKNGTQKKVELREIGEVSEEAVKGDVRSHAIRLGPAHVTEPVTRYNSKTAKEPLVAFQFKYRSNAALKSLGMIPRSPSPSPVPQPELTKMEEPPESTPNIPSRAISSSANSQPKADSATPAPLESVSRIPYEHDGLTEEDIIALIKHFRGNDKGLAGQSRKRLLVLLKHYENKDNEQVSIKQEAVPSESRVRIKREHTDDGVACGQGKKRKPEVIVLDD